MKNVIIAVLSFAILSGCGKKQDVTPANRTTEPSHNITSILTADDSLHMPAFDLKQQLITTAVNDKTLTLVLDENVNLLLSYSGYAKTSAVHLREDFKNSALPGFDFTTVNQDGKTTLNWVDDNLNNVILKSVTDTVVNGLHMVKINVHRPFTFFKVYDSNQAAVNEQNYLIDKKTDFIIFSSFCYYNQKNYPDRSVTANLVYVK